MFDSNTKLFPAIEELKRIPKWVAWKYEDRGGEKPTKPPINPHTGGYASTSNPSTWGTYEQAVDRARCDGLAGVGYVLTDDDGITGYDLDHCRDAKTGHIRKWARDVIDQAPTYAEVSPSGTGIRLLARSKIPNTIKCDVAGVE